MSDNKNIDHLSRLPPELLDHIFELVHKPQAFRVGDDTLQLVRSLSIDIAWKAESDLEPGPRDPEEEAEDYDYPSSQGFVDMLKRATEVEELLIQGSTRLALLVLSSSVAFSSLPNLQSLTLISTFVHLDDPFHPIHYSVLPYYATLQNLSLIIVRDLHSISSLPSNPIPSALLPFCSLRQLSLEGPILSSSHIPMVMTSLFNIAELSLEQIDGNVRLLKLVKLIPNPEVLEGLHVNFDDFNLSDRSKSSPPLNVSFDRFSNLRSLSIIGLVDLRSPAFYQDLGNLEYLEDLKFGFDTSLSVSSLSRSIDTLKLKSLVLDQFMASTSETDRTLWQLAPGYIDDDHLDRSPVEIIRPHWTDDFSKEGFKELRKKCLEKGVSLKGKTVQASDLEDRYDSGELERERAIRLEKKKKQEEAEAQEKNRDEE
ncbi:hypothetical protein JCM5350_001271 [Sporobolomyces pararoseus]